MRATQHIYRDGEWEEPPEPDPILRDAQLVLVFGSTALMRDGAWQATLRAAYPRADVIGCSSAGEICGDRVYDDTVVATPMRFEHARIASRSVSLDEVASSHEAGRRLAEILHAPDLVHVFVVSDGIHVNGSELVEGLTETLPKGVTVTGGLSGDGPRFADTVVMLHGEPRSHAVVGVGLYGDRLRVGYGSLGGWDPFGPYRTITRSKGNVLYELDGQSALAIYKRYLGDQAEALPASGLLFPLTLRSRPDEEPVVRTILAVDEAEQSLTFAGDVPEGMEARFMKANFNRLVDGAAQAARVSTTRLSKAPAVGVLISCVGRKMVLGPRVEEEVEAVRGILGPKAVLAGFYSYGEISPFTPEARCNLHNQTMTVTTFSEDEP